MNSASSHPIQAPRPGQGLTPQVGHTGQAPRPAWIEIDRTRLRRNLDCVRAQLPAGVGWLSVVKANAYGHGMVTVAEAAVAAGAAFLGVFTLEEAVQLRQAGIDAPVLLLGERHPDEFPFCLEHRLRVSVGDLENARVLEALAQRAGLCVPVHLKLNTGMNRFGVAWDQAGAAAIALRQLPGIVVEGVFSHFAMSDEADKTFAREQLRRFNAALADLAAAGLRPRVRHLCNSGGFLDLPEAHFDLVRLGILPLGVHPSAVCRRVADLEPVMTVKARFVAVREVQAGEVYGYGLRYRAPGPRRIGVLPLGYGDGYPRLRNTGHVLAGGQAMPIIGGVAMDAVGVDLTAAPGVGLWDEAVLLGRQGDAVITAHDIATWKGSVSYDILAGWRSRLPRLLVG